MTDWQARWRLFKLHRHIPKMRKHQLERIVSNVLDDEEAKLHPSKLLSLINAADKAKCCTWERCVYVAKSLIGVTKIPHTHDVFRRWGRWAWRRVWWARSAQPSTAPPHTLPCARPTLPEMEGNANNRLWIWECLSSWAKQSFDLISYLLMNFKSSGWNDRINMKTF